MELFVITLNIFIVSITVITCINIYCKAVYDNNCDCFNCKNFKEEEEEGDLPPNLNN